MCIRDSPFPGLSLPSGCPDSIGVAMDANLTSNQVYQKNLIGKSNKQSELKNIFVGMW